MKCRVQSTQRGGQFKGPPSAPEWTMGSMGKSNVVSGKSSGRQVDVRTSNVTMELGQGSIQCQVQQGQSCGGLTWSVECESVQIKVWVPRVQVECGVQSAKCRGRMPVIDRFMYRETVMRDFEVKADRLTGPDSWGIMRDFLEKWMFTAPKQSISVRHPSKTKSWVQSWRPRAKAFCDFSTAGLKYYDCHGKTRINSTKCACLANSQQTWRSDTPKCSPLQEISALPS